MSTLSVDHIVKRFGGNVILTGVSLRVDQGALTALIGPNGAGKSTLLDIITGQVAADEGRVMLGERTITGLSPRQRAEAGLGRTFQLARVFPSMSVVQNVQTALLAGRERGWRPWPPAGRFKRGRALSALREVSLATQADVPAGALAYGQRKRLELAMVLSLQPKVLLLDEPVAGLAEAERHQLMTLVRRLNTERGLTVLFTEHDLQAVFAYARRVVVMDRGQVIAQGSPGSIRADPRVQERYLGSTALSAPGQSARAPADPPGDADDPAPAASETAPAYERPSSGAA